MHSSDKYKYDIKMGSGESQETSICRCTTAIYQPLAGRNRRPRPRCVNPVLPTSLFMWEELFVVSNTDLSNMFDI